MKTKLFSVSLLVVLFLGQICFPVDSMPAHQSEGKSVESIKGEAKDIAGVEQTFSSKIDALRVALKAYRTAPEPVLWEEFWRQFHELATWTSLHHVDLLASLKNDKDFLDLGLYQLSSVAGLKISGFTRVPESQKLLVEWQETSSQRVAVSGKKRRRARTKIVTSTACHVQSIDCPAYVQVNDARVLFGKSGEESSLGAKLLILVGRQLKTGLAWLSGYRAMAGKWEVKPDIFSSVPPSLLQGVPGKANFAGTNLVFNLMSVREENQSNTAGDTAQGNSYKIVLRFTGSSFVLDTKSSLDAPTAIALQFMEAIQHGRIDLVKAWLVDPRLASIPNYLGLYSHSGTSKSLKLMAMTAPLSGSARYRIVTHDKDDLIIDIGRVKNQWVVKGIFVAPPDPLAKKLLGTSVPTDN